MEDRVRGVLRRRMRTDPNPGECCVGIHKVGFPFSRALEMLREQECRHLHLGCVCPGEPAPPRLLLSAAIRGPAGQPQERRRSVEPLEQITAKGGPEAMLTHLGEKERRRLRQNEKGGEHSVCYICIQRCPQKKVRKSEKQRSEYVPCSQFQFLKTDSFFNQIYRNYFVLGLSLCAGKLRLRAQAWAMASREL